MVRAGLEVFTHVLEISSSLSIPDERSDEIAYFSDKLCSFYLSIFAALYQLEDAFAKMR